MNSQIQNGDPEMAGELKVRERTQGVIGTQGSLGLGLEQIVVKSRVIIVEGISGSGKDTLQNYLKARIVGRDVYDYTEGEVLHSWKHFPIDGILRLRIKFMKLFANHMKDVITRGDDNAIFLLNRFHLSTYLTTVLREPSLELAYNSIIDVLKSLPVYVFILQLEENEIEAKSSHPERAQVWRKLQQAMVEKDGLRGKFERYAWQQKLMVEIAEKQGMPYSLVKSSTFIPAMHIYDRDMNRLETLSTKGALRGKRSTRPVEEKV